MVEDNILNNDKKNKKKILLWGIIIVLVLVVLVIGTTYAFFTMGTINNSEDTEITITTGPRDNVKLTGGITNYKLHLEVVDMAFNRVGNNYYGTTDGNKNYETEVEAGTKIIGNLELDGEFVDDYTCTATVNVGLEGNMQSELHENDLVLVIMQGNTETEYDLSKDITSPSFSFDLENIEPIKAYLKFTNQNTDQSGLAGKTLNVTINVTDFKCEIEKSVLSILQKTTDSDHLKVAYEGDELLRYIGNYDEVTYKTDSVKKAINNFICFGTNNIDTCTKTPATYMYRIIGITTDNVNASLGLHKGQLKIIKASPSITSQVWNNNYSSDIPWDSADIQKTYLNTTFMKTITDIKELVGTHNWSDLIGVNETPNNGPKWYIGDNTNATGTNVEVTSKTSQNHKIGLMYASDYHNSWSYTSNTNSWLHISHGMTGSTNYNEWTMTRYGYNGNNNAWYVDLSNGHLNASNVTNAYAVRPVFYLTSDIRLSGEGTESNPFIISEG